MSDNENRRLLDGFGANKVNASDPKERSVLPGTTSHNGYGDYEDDSCAGKTKKYKWWIIGGSVILIVAIILGVTLGGKSPIPDPPGPQPPSTYNPYSVD